MSRRRVTSSQTARVTAELTRRVRPIAIAILLVASPWLLAIGFALNDNVPIRLLGVLLAVGVILWMTMVVGPVFAAEDVRWITDPAAWMLALQTGLFARRPMIVVAGLAGLVALGVASFR
jgi:hypothetical protein